MTNQPDQSFDEKLYEVLNDHSLIVTERLGRRGIDAVKALFLETIEGARPSGVFVASLEGSAHASTYSKALNDYAAELRAKIEGTR